MKSSAIWVLVVINVLLLAAFVGRVATPNTAFGQARPAPQRPGDFLMIPGEVTGGSTAVVYILDTTNSMLGALAYDDSQRQLQTMPNRIDLSQVFTQGPVAPAREGRR